MSKKRYYDLRRYLGAVVLSIIAGPLAMIGSADAQPVMKKKYRCDRFKPGYEHFVRRIEADRCRPPECGVC
jgi:hypothetical protein